MEEVIRNVLYRSSRPGYPSKDVDLADVGKWVEAAQKKGIRSILCLLDDRQLAFYPRLGSSGLLGVYRQAGFKVVHRPIPDYQSPPVSPEMLEQIAEDFLAAELPMLVHCSAGCDRTGAVVAHLRKIKR